MKNIVGFSGGIDSQACLRWVRENFGDENVIALNTRAGRNESPVTDAFIDNFSATVFPVVTITPLVCGHCGWMMRSERTTTYYLFTCVNSECPHFGIIYIPVPESAIQLERYVERKESHGQESQERQEGSEGEGNPAAGKPAVAASRPDHKLNEKEGGQ